MFTGKQKQKQQALSRYRLLRGIASVTASSMAWLIAGPGVAAGVRIAHTPKPQGHTRTLNQTEMARIVGAQVKTNGAGGPAPIGVQHALSESPDGGSTYPWEGNVGGANTGNGNKMTELPIVSWKARGGRLGVNLSLFHSSEGNHNSELGHKWTHSYDIFLVPNTTTGDIEVHWGNDLSYPFSPNIAGGFDAPVGIHDTFVQTGTGTSATYDLTTKNQIVYHFAYVSNGSSGGGWYCTSITDRNSNSITIAHNSSGFVTSVTDPTSRVLTFSYTSGKLTGISDPLSRSWTLHYDSNDDLISVDLPAVGSTVYSMGYGYNANHDITSITDLRGKVWTKDYYSDDSIKWEKDPLNNQTSYTYAAGYTQITDANGHFIKHFYTSGRLTSVQDGAGQTEYYSYDSNSNKTGITDKRGKAWGFTFDSAGNCLTKTDPLSHVTTYTYNSRNDVTSVETELGHETDYVYNTAGNLTSVTDPLLHSTSYGYDSYGQGTSVTDALSHATTTGYDTNGNATNVTDALSHSSTSTHDGVGRVTSVTDATSKTTSTAYDALNRVTSITTPGSRTTTFAYADGSSLKSSVTDPLSHSNSYAYDDAGRLTNHTDPNSHTVYFGYDYVGNKTSFTDGNSHTTYYSYTNRNELSGILYPDSTGESYSYNANGNLQTKTDGRSVTATNTYDDAGRLTGTSYNDSVTASVSFSYDHDDHKTGMSDGTGTYTYSYDDAGHITQRATPDLTVSFGYDNANRRITRTLGTGSTTFSYDDANRLVSLIAPGASGNETTSYTYDDAGRKLTMTFANGDIETDSYSNTTGELVNVLHQNSTTATISSYAYLYRADGLKSSETLADGSVNSYIYDNAGQLTGESQLNISSSTVYSLSYTYDDAGNRATKSDGMATEYYTYDNANKLTSAGDKTYDYDDAGNVTSVTNTTTNVKTDLAWDGASRLLNINNGSTATVNAVYAYNGLGQRVGKIDSSNNVFTYTHAGDGVASPILSDGVARYTRGVDLVSEVRNNVSKFYHLDGLGSTNAITNAVGTTTNSHETDAFGNTVSTTGTTLSPFGFVGNSGYQTDSDTGLMLLGHRYYDSTTGRFLSRDPILAGYNWYTYCGNNPVNAVDPEGENWRLGLIGKIANAVAAAIVTLSPVQDTTVGQPTQPVVTNPSGGIVSGPAEPSPEPDPFGDEEGPQNPNEGSPGAGGDPPKPPSPPSNPTTPSAGGGAADPPSTGGGGRWRTLPVQPGGRGTAGGGRKVWVPSPPSGGEEGGEGGGDGGVVVGGGGCFVAGTLVTMADGNHKPIEEVQAGDMVLSCNTATGEVKPQPVVETYVHEVNNPLLLMSFSSGDTVVATRGHPFYVAGTGFVKAGSLPVGSKCVSPKGHDVRLMQIQVPRHAQTKVYNFHVKDFHTYYVGSTGILVHNNSELEPWVEHELRGD